MILILGAAAVLFFGGGALAINGIIVPAFEEIERKTAAEEAFRVQRAIEEDCASLFRFVSEWTERDEIRNFVHEGTALKVPYGIGKTASESLGINALVVLRGDGVVLWGHEFNRDEQLPAPEWLVNAVRVLPVKPIGAKGILISDKGVPAVTAFHSVPSLDGTQAIGLVGMARYMDTDYDFSLFRRLRVRLQLTPMAEGKAAPPSTVIDEKYVHASLPLFDVFLDKGLMVTVDVPRQFVPTMALALTRMNILVSGMALGMAAVLWFVLRREIIVPIRQITNRIRNFARGEGVRIGSVAGSLDDLPVSRQDEVGEIAAEIAFLHDRIVDLANRDPLTGIATRRPFQDRLSHALVRASRYSYTVAILFIDLDGFKPINDTYGHAAGDVILKTVALRLEQTLRKSDSVARIGGDEFAILLENPITRDEASLVAAKVGDAIRTPIVFEGNELSVGASIGVAVFPADGGDMDGLMAAADKAMYASKPHRRDTRGPSPAIIGRQHLAG